MTGPTFPSPNFVKKELCQHGGIKRRCHATTAMMGPWKVSVQKIKVIKEPVKWYFYSENGVKLADGFYKQNDKVGLWNYFNDSGIPTTIENNDTGEITVMDEAGNINRNYFLRDGKIDGTFTLFYACGAINETRTYQGGKKDGPVKLFLLTEDGS